MVSRFEDRTNRKLRFAEINLEEIASRPELGSADDFERAHEESFLFHLLGAKDSFLQEINAAYELGLPIRKVREETLKNALKKKELKSPALARIIELKEDKNSRLAIAIELRNHGTHRSHIPRHFVRGSGQDKNYFYNPLTGERIEADIQRYLRRCLANMTELLQQLRATLPQK